jgi:hypothetical protein
MVSCLGHGQHPPLSTQYAKQIKLPPSTPFGHQSINLPDCGSRPLIPVKKSKPLHHFA